jgi:hypothetical protein
MHQNLSQPPSQADPARERTRIKAPKGEADWYSTTVLSDPTSPTSDRSFTGQDLPKSTGRSCSTRSTLWFDTYVKGHVSGEWRVGLDGSSVLATSRTWCIGHGYLVNGVVAFSSSSGQCMCTLVFAAGSYPFLGFKRSESVSWFSGDQWRSYVPPLVDHCSLMWLRRWILACLIKYTAPVFFNRKRILEDMMLH